MVKSCTDLGAVDFRNHSNDPKVSQLSGDPASVYMWWGQSYCLRTQRISVAKATVGGLAGYDVTVVPTSFDPSCMDAPDAHAVDIEFAASVDPSTVSLDVGSGIVECDRVGQFGRRVGAVAIDDGTGLVTSCTQSPAPSDNATADLPNPYKQIRSAFGGQTKRGQPTSPSRSTRLAATTSSRAEIGVIRVRIRASRWSSPSRSRSTCRRFGSALTAVHLLRRKCPLRLPRIAPLRPWRTCRLRRRPWTRHPRRRPNSRAWTGTRTSIQCAWSITPGLSRDALPRWTLLTGPRHLTSPAPRRTRS